MNISSSYSVAGSISGYGTQTASQTSSKPFVIPICSDEEVKANNLPETNKNRNFTITNYDPFKDVKTGSVTLPEWMQTKTEPRRSDAEILKDMEKLAREHVGTGLFQDNDPRFQELMDEYLSSVSPDREGILKNSVNEINERIATEIYPERIEDIEEKEKNKDLVGYLLDAFSHKAGKGKDSDIISSNIATRGNSIASSSSMYNIAAVRHNGTFTEIDFDYGGGKTTTVMYDRDKLYNMTMKGAMYDVGWIDMKSGAVKDATFYDGNGEKIMTYSNSNDNKDGLVQLHTSAEYARRKEIQAVYNASYDFAYGRYNEPSTSLGSADISHSYFNGSFDPKQMAKDAYISTYERLRNEAV
jgi:hypothetical protein